MIKDVLGNPAQIGTLTATIQVVNISAVSARTTVLKPNTPYRIYVDIDSWILFGNSAVTATSSHHPLKAGIGEVFATDDVNIYLAGISTGAGKMYVSEIQI